MRAVARALGKRWLGGLVVYRGRSVREIDPDHQVWEMPAHRLFT